MLRVGLTGGIGSGKSTVARLLVARGAVLVDSDVLAREAVAPGSDGLAEVVAEFGERVLGPGGELDRPALAGVVFGDADARGRLNAIVHPRVRARSDELVAAAPADAIVVQDVPLLVEGGMAPTFPLVVVVHVDAEERVRRLVSQRGTPEADARARIAAQADDAQRRAAADFWLDNGGAPDDLRAAVDALWDDRLRPFEENLRRGRAVPLPTAVTAPDPDRPADAARLAARVAAAAGARGRGVSHVGPGSVADVPAPDVVELQLGVEPAAPEGDAAALRDALTAVGFPPAGPDPGEHGSADPGRPALVRVREVGSAPWREELLLRDWLRARPDERALLRTALEASPSVVALGSWWDTARPRAREWGVTSAWGPSLD